MISLTTRLLIALTLLALFITCKSGNEEEKLARTYCASCHLFPEPQLLDKAAWEKGVLPAMGKLLGRQGLGNDPFAAIDDRYSTTKAAVPLAEWRKIVHYYLTAAPEIMPPQNRPAIKKFTERFTVRQPAENLPPAATFLKIDAGNHWIYAASNFDSSLHIFDAQLNKLQQHKVGGIVSDIYFESNLQDAGARQGVLTSIGIMHPNDLKTGSIAPFAVSKEGKPSLQNKLSDSIPRPVQTIPADFDRDGNTDYLVCGFGNKAGALYWLHNSGNGVFEQRMLRSLPGAIKAYVQDFNRDGLPDIMALFAQGDEGVFMFINKGNGQFQTQKLLSFPPVYGSSYFELQDFNGDGLQDILYTCGDNADYSFQSLKNYHGVYIFINSGNYHFKQRYFFPMYGAFKAVARDFDLDGDLDIAAISYFPDKKERAQESFVYLQANAALDYEPFVLPEYHLGNWITMDAADADGDGDDDIVIGSLLPPNAQQQKGTTGKPLFLLLQNRTR